MTYRRSNFPGLEAHTLSRTSSSASSSTFSLRTNSLSNSSGADAHFFDAPSPKASFSAKWDIIWSKGIAPGQGFDAGRASGVLVRLLQRAEVQSRALVPGFGRGYDLIEIAKAGMAEVVGIEISRHAIATAQDYLHKSNTPPHVLSRIKHLHADFLTYQPTITEKYDLGWEYTFLSSLHPSMFEAWARAWGRAIAPDGILATLMIDDLDGGPVSPALYKELLEAEGFMCIAMEPVDPALSLPGREGREVLALWQRLTA